MYRFVFEFSLRKHINYVSFLFYLFFFRFRILDSLLGRGYVYGVGVLLELTLKKHDTNVSFLFYLSFFRFQHPGFSRTRVCIWGGVLLEFALKKHDTNVSFLLYFFFF